MIIKAIAWVSVRLLLARTPTTAKPVALVSYGGVSAGLRAAQMINQVLSAVSLVPMKTGTRLEILTPLCAW